MTLAFVLILFLGLKVVEMAAAVKGGLDKSYF